MGFKGILALFGFGNNSLIMIKMFYTDINTSTTKRVNINRDSTLFLKNTSFIPLHQYQNFNLIIALF